MSGNKLRDSRGIAGGNSEKGEVTDMSTISTALEQPAEGKLHRNIDWRGAFWVASGVPALVLFSIGGIAGTTGTLAFVIWTRP